MLEKGCDNLEIRAKLDEICKQKEFNLSIDDISKMCQEEQMILTIINNGFGKRTSSYEYLITGRGGKGIGNINLQEEASVVMTTLADNNKDIMMIGTKGKTIRINAENIALVGRKTKGVKVFNLENGETIASVSILDREDN